VGAAWYSADLLMPVHVAGSDADAGFAAWQLLSVNQYQRPPQVMPVGAPQVQAEHPRVSLTEVYSVRLFG